MFIVTLAVCTTAAIYDLKTRLIPDWITIPYLLLGLAFSLAQHGLSALVIFIALFLLCEIVYRLNVFGGGDLKLLLGIAFFGGLKFGFLVFYFSLLAALPLFLVYMLKEKSRTVSVPYAVAILAGVILGHYYETTRWWF